MIVEALSALIIVRNLKKIADRGKSIAGNVLFWMEGTEIHTPEDRKCSAVRALVTGNGGRYLD
jgi:phosphate uptake regulator